MMPIPAITAAPIRVSRSRNFAEHRHAEKKRPEQYAVAEWLNEANVANPHRHPVEDIPGNRARRRDSQQ